MKDIHRTIYNNEKIGHMHLVSYVNSLQSLNSTQKSQIFHLHNLAIDDMEDEDDDDDLDIEEISFGDTQNIGKRPV